MAVPGAGLVSGSTSTDLWRLGFVALGVAAMVLGYLGFEEFLGGAPLLDVVYHDLQLFVLGAPEPDGAPLPATLEFARFAAPAVTVYALVEAARALFAAEIMRLRARFSRGHDVVCGTTLVADALVERLVERRRRVVRIPAEPAAAPTLRRVLVVPGNPASAGVLRNAGVGRARALYVCTADSTRNLAVADLAGRVPRGRSAPLQAYVAVDDPEFCLSLQARRLGLPPSRRIAVNFFSSHELAARRLLETQPPPAGPGGRPPRIMVVGASWFAMALIVELARHWRLAGPGLADRRRAHRLPIVLVDDNAGAAARRLGRLYPFVADTCVFTGHELRVRDMLDGDLPEEPPDRVYLCSVDDAVSLKLAVTMDHFWRRGPDSVVVRLRHLGRLGTVFDASHADPLLEGVSGTLRLFDAVRAGSDPRLVEDGLAERLARTVHEHYLTAQARAGVPPDSGRAMRPWQDLSEELKAANRDQAVHIGVKLRAIGCALAPNPIWGAPERFDAATVELLARMEHERWCAWLRATGRAHHDLVDWSDLAESSRQKNRAAVAALPAILADAGFQIVRVVARE